jgi:phenylpropionate dioxygenase-like ring-hydroxylating dioxygenase large terminal subunit
MNSFQTPADLVPLIDRQRPGWSLEQPFYIDPEIYAHERALWFPRQWMLIAHVSELPSKGSHIVRDLFGSEIVIVNAGEEGFRAFHNVCTHRGSRICKTDGKAPLLVCPYHAWSFRLNGELQTTKDLPADANPTRLSLHRVPLREAGGLILCGLDETSLPDLQPAFDALLPAMRHHGFDRAKIATRRSYATAANWKLVLENFFECYHCRPSHPEYFRMNAHVKVTALRDEAQAAEWERDLAAWHETVGEDAHTVAVRAPGDIDAIKFTLRRLPIGLDRKTASRDGKAVAPLMGNFTAYDGGETAIHFGRMSFAGAYNDHIVLFQFIPRGVEDTEVIVTWLVDGDADLDSIDMDSLTFMWDVTTKQDKQIIEENVAGVRSPAYRPGPYTLLEAQTAEFVVTYLDAMKRLSASEGR